MAQQVVRQLVAQDSGLEFKSSKLTLKKNKTKLGMVINIHS